MSLVVPSVIAADGDAEGLPSVIPEAMAQACPVIGSDQGGIAEAVRSGVTGLLVPPGDAAALAAAMHTLATDPEARTNGRCRVPGRLNEPECAAAIEEAGRSVAGSGRQRRREG